jgi:hypothetical protein
MNDRTYCDQPHPGSDTEADRWCEMYHRPTAPKPAPAAPAARSAAGDPCSKQMIDNRGKNHGCRGRVVIENGKYRGPDGVLTVRPMLVCNRCGQAHGFPAHG